MVQGIFLHMTNSVNKQNASDISLFISVLKHYIHNMGSQQCDKYRGKFVCNNSCQTRGKNGKAHSSQYSDLQLLFHVNNQ